MIQSIRPPFSRRQFFAGASACALSLPALAEAQSATKPDHVLRIAPLSLELAPKKIVKTFAYDGTVPGPTLRLRQGRKVSIEVRNETDIDDIVHWHGLYVPSDVDGSM